MRAVLAMVIVAAIVFACGEDRPPCYRGDFIGCNCTDGASGYSACRDAEDGYGRCVCNGTIPGVDAGPRDAARDAIDGPAPSTECNGEGACKAP